MRPGGSPVVACTTPCGTWTTRKACGWPTSNLSRRAGLGTRVGIRHLSFGCLVQISRYVQGENASFKFLRRKADPYNEAYRHESKRCDDFYLADCHSRGGLRPKRFQS